jgi:thiamine biosynthesis protein ThiS
MNIKNKIKIKVNGKKIIFDNNTSIEKLTKKLKIPLNKVAIELNKKILDKKKLKKIKLNNNDKIEIVHFIGGG